MWQQHCNGCPSQGEVCVGGRCFVATAQSAGESMAGGTFWAIAQRLELLPSDSPSLVGKSELSSARKEDYEESRNRWMAKGNQKGDGMNKNKGGKQDKGSGSKGDRREDTRGDAGKRPDRERK